MAMRNAFARSLSGTVTERKIKRIFVIVAIGFGIVALRLFYLQIINYTHYRTLSNENSLRLIPQRAPRGLITDRNGVVLATNRPTYTLFLVPADLKTHASTLVRLSGILGVPVADLEKRVAERHRSRKFEPLRIQGHLPEDLIARIEENRARLPGVYIQMEPERYYPHGSFASHVLGYIGEISESELFRLRDRGYRVADILGKKGVEKVYDPILRGELGGVQVEVNASGVQRRILAYRPPVQGHTVALTIDAKVQRLAEELLGEQAGAVIVSNPRNGEVLAMASKPGFDPNLFVDGISYKDWDRLLKDKLHPLQNRAIQGRYPPGSIFKIVTTVSSLEDERFDRDRTRLCRGIFWYKTWPYRCWLTSGHGWVNLSRAIIESCDIYFYQLGLDVKIDKLYRACRRFGLGSKTRVDLDSEDSGLVPNPKWKEATQHMPWFPGNTIQMSIGQGYLLTTPLQMMNVTCAMAMRNRVYQHHLLLRVLDQRTRRPRLERRRELLLDAGVSKEHLDVLRDALEKVVGSGAGTGKRARIPGVRVAGKTGTSENPHGENHAWFTSWAPVEDPQVAVIVMVENGGEGGVVAAPIAKRLMEAVMGMEVTPMEKPTPTEGPWAPVSGGPTPSPMAVLTPVVEGIP
jgi:penicillin-binding protein 2